jgi:hypothetical protein
MTKNKSFKLLCTGGYDYNITLYEVSENLQNYYLLGELFNGSNNIIHQLKFIKKEKKDENILFLFVASDQKIFNIYRIV